MTFWDPPHTRQPPFPFPPSPPRRPHLDTTSDVVCIWQRIACSCRGPFGCHVTFREAINPLQVHDLLLFSLVFKRGDMHISMVTCLSTEKCFNNSTTCSAKHDSDAVISQSRKLRPFERCFLLLNSSSGLLRWQCGQIEIRNGRFFFKRRLERKSTDPLQAAWDAETLRWMREDQDTDCGSYHRKRCVRN